MNDKEEYGFELKLLVSNFMNSLKNVGNAVKSFATQAKRDASTTIDVEATEPILRLAQLNAQIRDLKREMSSLPTGDKAFETYAYKLNECQQEAKQLNEQLKQTGNITNTSFKGTIKTSKRFLLSLLSVRSAYSLISRASRQYLSENKELASSVEILSSSIGNILAPVIKKVVDIAQYGFITIAKLIQMITGYDVVGKVIESANNRIDKSAKDASKSMGSLNKQLSGFDTIQNLNDDNNIGSSTINDLEAQVTALDEFKKKVEEVEKIFEQYEKPIQFATTALLALVGVSMLGKIANFIGNAGKLTGLQGIFGSLSSIATYSAITISIVMAVKGYQEIKEFEKDMQEWNNRDTTYKKQWIADEEEINSLLATQNVNRKNAYDLYLKSGLAIYEMLGWSDEMLTTAINNVKQSQNYLDKWNKILNTTELTEDENKKILNTLQEQYKSNGDIIKRMELLGQDTTELRKINDGYNETIEKIKGNLEEMTKKKYSIDFKMNADTSDFATKVQTALKNVFGENYKDNSLVKLVAKFQPKQVKELMGFDVGTNYVPNDMIAQVHKGEQIIPAKWNPATSGIYGSNEEVVEKLDKLIETLENKDMNAYISKNAIAEATNSYNREQSRIMNRGVA